mmetsp:Transcript_3050/g.8853  ORF Transcript_3050/g.8853 Transcript_3050/m.8853 type:complete len:471 (+) Transcript_3050:609-2021(+)
MRLRSSVSCAAHWRSSSSSKACHFICACSDLPSRRRSSKFRERSSSSRCCSWRRRVRYSKSRRAASSRAARSCVSRSPRSRSSRNSRSVSSCTLRSNSSCARCLSSASRWSSSRRFRSSSLMASSSAIFRRMSWRRRSSRAECGLVLGRGSEDGDAPPSAMASPTQPCPSSGRRRSSLGDKAAGDRSNKRDLRLFARTRSAFSRIRRALSSNCRVRSARMGSSTTMGTGAAGTGALASAPSAPKLLLDAGLSAPCNVALLPAAPRNGLALALVLTSLGAPGGASMSTPPPEPHILRPSAPSSAMPHWASGKAMMTSGSAIAMCASPPLPGLLRLLSLSSPPGSPAVRSADSRGVPADGASPVSLARCGLALRCRSGHTGSNADLQRFDSGSALADGEPPSAVGCCDGDAECSGRCGFGFGGRGGPPPASPVRGRVGAEGAEGDGHGEDASSPNCSRSSRSNSARRCARAA